VFGVEIRLSVLRLMPRICAKFVFLWCIFVTDVFFFNSFRFCLGAFLERRSAPCAKKLRPRSGAKLYFSLRVFIMKPYIFDYFSEHFPSGNPTWWSIWRHKSSWNVVLSRLLFWQNSKFDLFFGSAFRATIRHCGEQLTLRSCSKFGAFLRHVCQKKAKFQRMHRT